ncbi:MULTISPECIES: SDR family NAD(P)-dependent oxidoreductase [unclassified Pseudomonas]|uniref:SDR family NAD(P)-dependent oxidoreductase n=1 Tax=unclassified Pseudomonas TaxID=196821 RepID=UPI001647134E|nr:MULTISPECIES: SDR family NAD(P)-dependent oxidoreductase [unclassified Pseudomonas]MBC3422372.1 SDR family oxidoreductase [Pseudomonas sp. RW3S2]MBC3465781.1 SDR family oxidoreductase [Pseudomonas sp. RW10S2]
MQFQGKTIVVTGGSSGIGLSISRRLSEEGARVVVLGRSLEKGRSALEQLGAQASFIPCDVAEPGAVRDAFAEIEARFGGLDHAVNAAGITAPYAQVADLQVQDWERVVRINLNGPLFCLQHELRLIARKPGGSIVNLSSCAGVMAMPNQAAYVASKAGLNALTQVVAMENACDRDGRHAVRVNAVAPGPILGGMNSPERLAANPAGTERKINATVMKRFGEASEVAAAVLFLLGDGASYMTGSVLSVDGGYHIGKFE